MDVTAVTGIVSTVAAVAAALWAWSSARSAKQSYVLSREQDLARRPNLNVYLVDGERVLFTSAAQRVYRFHLRVTNLADAPNAIARIELVIEYARGDAAGLRLVIPHDPSINQSFDVGIGRAIPVPHLLQPKDVIAGWAVFVVPCDLQAGARTDMYRVLVVDTSENAFDVRPVIIPEREI